MTKSVLVTLVLVGICLGIMRVTIFDRPPADPARSLTTTEQSQIAAEDSGQSSQADGRNAATRILAQSSAHPAKPTRHTPATTARASGKVRQLQGRQRASEFSPDEQMEGPAISGLVQDTAGYALANIEVLAVPIVAPGADGATEDSALEIPQSTWTDFDGSFVFGNLAGDEYRIRVAPLDGFAEAEIKVRVGVKSANLVLEPLRNIRVYGIVSSPDGIPIEDVRVIAGPPTRVTNSGREGHYEFELSLKEKSTVKTIHFRSEGYRDQSRPLDLAQLDGALDEFPLDVTMERIENLTTVAGRLEDPQGRPVAGKLLNLNSPKLRTRYRAQSDLEGNFLIEGVEPGQDYRLSVRPGGDYHDYEKTRLEIPEYGQIFDIVLEPLGHGGVFGYMTDVSGQSVPGFALTLHSEGATGKSVRVVSDAQGYFEAEGFPEGKVVMKTNSYPFFEVKGIRSSQEAENPVSLVLDLGPHEISGQVTDLFGETVAAPELSLGWQHLQNGLQNYSARKTIADQNGNFSFTGLGQGVHTLRVNAPGFGKAEVRIDVGIDPNHIVVELGEES